VRITPICASAKVSARRCASAPPTNVIRIRAPLARSTSALSRMRVAITSALSTFITSGIAPYRRDQHVLAAQKGRWGYLRDLLERASILASDGMEQQTTEHRHLRADTVRRVRPNANVQRGHILDYGAVLGAESASERDGCAEPGEHAGANWGRHACDDARAISQAVRSLVGHSHREDT
jgi:hypothetical protein